MEKLVGHFGKMLLEEIQQFQEKHEIAGADDMVGADQPYRTSVGMHQDYIWDLPIGTESWISNLPGQTHQEEIEPLDKTVNFKKAKVVLVEQNAWRSHHQKESSTSCIKLRIRGRDCIPGFRGKVVAFWRKVVDNRFSRASSKTMSHWSRSSKRSSNSNSSADSKSINSKLKGKINFPKLLAQEAFLEKQQQIENEIEKLKIQEKNC